MSRVRLVLATAASIAGLATPSALGATVDLSIDRAAAVLEPEDEGFVEASVDGLAKCSLLLEGKRARSIDARVTASGATDIRWRWTLPSKTRTMPWTATVSCWRDLDAGPSAAPDARQRLTIRIDGQKRGPRRLVDRRGLLAATSDSDRKSDPKWTEVAQIVLGVLGLVLTFGGLYLVFTQLKQSGNEGRAARVASLLERYQDRAFMTTVTKALRYVKAASAGECWDRVMAWREAPSSESELVPVDAGDEEDSAPVMNDARQIMQFFEELAGQFNSGSIDTDLARRLFSEVITATFRQYWWLLCVLREGHLGAIADEGTQFRTKLTDERRPGEIPYFNEWEVMARGLLIDVPLTEGARCDSEVWVLCLPPGQTPPERYGAYRQLTVRLSRPFGNLSELEEAFALRESTLAGKPARNVLCIAHWQLELDEHRRCQALALAIEQVILADPTLTKIEGILTTAEAAKRTP